MIRIALVGVLAVVAVVLIAGQWIEGERFEIVDQKPNGCFVVERQHIPALPGPNEVLDRTEVCP